jgi:hypothetical protein
MCLNLQEIEMENICYFGSLGVQILLDCGMDLSSATSIVFNVLLPDGVTTATWAAAYFPLSDPLEYVGYGSGATNWASYTTQEGDLPQTGNYQIQPEITLSETQVYFCDPDTLTVEPTV